MNSLREKIEAYEIDDGESRLTFLHRLARENGWRESYARRCIIEYKRFTYLCAIAAEAMTPSDQVDQVWHLHLTYTRSYWIRFCGETLGFDLHHEPTKGGAEQAELFRQQYNNTLQRYRIVFNEDPPADIWPGAEERFRHSARFVRVNKNHTWTIPKPSHIFAFLALVPVLLVACTQEEGVSDIWFYIKLAVAVYFIYKVIRWLNSYGGGKGGGHGGGCGGGCSGCGGG